MKLIPPFFSNLSILATRPVTVHRDELAKIFFGQVHNIRIASAPLKKGVRSIYWEQSDAAKSLNRLANKIRTVKGWKKHLKDYKLAVKAMHKAGDNAKACAKLPLKKCESILQDWIDANILFADNIAMPFAIEAVLDQELRQLLEKELGQKADQAFNIICSPSRLNDFQKMRLRIAESAIQNNITKKNLNQLTKDFYWYNEYSFVEPLLDQRYFEKEIRKLDKKSAREEIKRMKKEVEKNRNNYAKLRKQLHNPDLRLLAEIIHAYTFLRTDRIDHFKRCQAKARGLLYKIADEMSKTSGKNWPEKMTANLLHSELMDFIKKGNLPNYKDVQQRVKQDYIYYFENNKVTILHDAATIKLAIKMIKNSQEKNKQIKGMIAFKGKIKGRVVLVLSKEDLSKVKKGNVLVAKTTMPDFTHEMHRAAAFVTEEGGVTSHAAVVARELKKPCIVGTGNCTKILKDGDVIEVNAEKGIVRKVSK